LPLFIQKKKTFRNCSGGGAPQKRKINHEGTKDTKVSRRKNLREILFVFAFRAFFLDASKVRSYVTLISSHVTRLATVPTSPKRDAGYA
jgi:hypothetical protein